MKNKRPSIIKRVVLRYLIAVSAIVFLVVGFWRPGLLRGEPNIGHQLGGDVFDEFSGNTIECFVRGVKSYESHAKWRYSECDIRETKDHCLVVYHDWDISRVPNTLENQRILGCPVENQAICELTLGQVQQLKLRCGCHIPTLEEILETARSLEIKKPLILEFKYLHSDQGREQILDLARRYRDDHGLDIQFLAFIRNVTRSFPDSSQWLAKFKESNFRVYQVFRPMTEEYDLCKTWQ